LKKYPKLTKENVPEREIDEKVVSSGFGSLSTSTGNEKQQISQDGNDDGYYIESDPTPPICFVENVGLVTGNL